MSGIYFGISIDKYKDMESIAFVGRKLAMNRGAAIYVGRPCKNCGTRIKRTSRCSCLYCDAKRSANRSIDKIEKTNTRTRYHDAEYKALMKSLEL